MARKAKTPPLVNEKYSCTKDPISGLYRIQLIRDIGNQDDWFWMQEGMIGGLISENGDVGVDDYSWVYENAKLVKSKISDSVFVNGNSYVENSVITGKCEIIDNAQIYNCELSGSITVSGNAILRDCKIIGNNINISGNSKILNGVTIIGDNISCTHNTYINGNGNLVIEQSNISFTHEFNEFKSQIYARYGMPNEDGYFTTYKLVKSTDLDQVYKSFFDDTFLYDLRNPKLNTFEIKNIPNVSRQCGPGLHVCFKNTEDAFSWMGKDYNDCDIMLTCLVYKNDIEYIDMVDKNNHKARVSKLKVIKAEKWPLVPEVILPSITLTHGMNTTYMVPCIYNKEDNTIVYNYTIEPYNKNAVKVIFNEDENTELINKYRFTLLTPKKENTKVLPPVTTYKLAAAGNGKMSEITVNHNFDSKNFIPLVYTKDKDNPETMIDKTRDCKFTLVDENNLLVEFDKKLKTGEIYNIALIKPPAPTVDKATGDSDSAGLVNGTEDSKVFLFMGYDINEEDNTIYFKHDKDTYDCYGVIYDIDSNEYHLFDFDTLYLDKNNIKLTINFSYYKNHQFAYFMCWF